MDSSCFHVNIVTLGYINRIEIFHSVCKVQTKTVHVLFFQINFFSPHWDIIKSPSFHVTNHYCNGLTLAVCLSGGGRRGVEEPPQAERLRDRRQVPRPLQVHSGLSWMPQGFCDLWPLLLPERPASRQQGARHGGVLRLSGPVRQARAGGFTEKL